MPKLDRIAVAGSLALVLALGASAAEAKQCWKKTAEGTGGDAAGAKFQVDEALLQSVDWGAWAAWMAGGGTPGYSFGARSYKCSPGGMGVSCRGTSTICKL